MKTAAENDRHRDEDFLPLSKRKKTASIQAAPTQAASTQAPSTQAVPTQAAISQQPKVIDAPATPPPVQPATPTAGRPEVAPENAFSHMMANRGRASPTTPRRTQSPRRPVSRNKPTASGLVSPGKPFAGRPKIVRAPMYTMFPHLYGLGAPPAAQTEAPRTEAPRQPVVSNTQPQEQSAIASSRPPRAKMSQQPATSNTPPQEQSTIGQSSPPRADTPQQPIISNTWPQEQAVMIQSSPLQTEMPQQPMIGNTLPQERSAIVLSSDAEEDDNDNHNGGKRSAVGQQAPAGEQAAEPAKRPVRHCRQKVRPPQEVLSRLGSLSPIPPPPEEKDHSYFPNSGRRKPGSRRVRPPRTTAKNVEPVVEENSKPAEVVQKTKTRRLKLITRPRGDENSPVAAEDSDISDGEVNDEEGNDGEASD